MHTGLRKKTYHKGSQRFLDPSSNLFSVHHRLYDRYIVRENMGHAILFTVKENTIVRKLPFISACRSDCLELSYLILFSYACHTLCHVLTSKFSLVITLTFGQVFYFLFFPSSSIAIDEGMNIFKHLNSYTIIK